MYAALTTSLALGARLPRHFRRERMRFSAPELLLERARPAFELFHKRDFQRRQRYFPSLLSSSGRPDLRVTASCSQGRMVVSNSWLEDCTLECSCSACIEV